VLQRDESRLLEFGWQDALTEVLLLTLTGHFFGRTAGRLGLLPIIAEPVDDLAVVAGEAEDGIGHTTEVAIIRSTLDEVARASASRRGNVRGLVGVWVEPTYLFEKLHVGLVSVAFFFFLKGVDVDNDVGVTKASGVFGLRDFCVYAIFAQI
jgi:hypothetical protein